MVVILKTNAGKYPRKKNAIKTYNFVYFNYVHIKCKYFAPYIFISFGSYLRFIVTIQMHYKILLLTNTAV